VSVFGSSDNGSPGLSTSDGHKMSLLTLLLKGKMIMQDKMEKERADAKNAVEEYVYEMRDKLSGPLSQFMLESVRSVFLFSTYRHLFHASTTGRGHNFLDLYIRQFTHLVPNL